MLGQREVVRVVGRRQAEVVGEDKRLIVQPGRVVIFGREGEEVVEMLRGCNQRQTIPGSHALTQNIHHFERQQRRRNNWLAGLHGSAVQRSGAIASFLIENPLDRDRRVRADHDN